MNARPPPDPRRLPPGDDAWEADWDDFVTLHFTLPPERLAPHIPYELDLHDGTAWVSLVWFTLHRLRFAGTGRVGRWLCRPISDHPFLNVRTYVRHPDGDGICFLAEWITNPLNVLLGPLTYGLPYRPARFATQTRPTDGVAMLRIDARGQRAPFALTVPLRRDDRTPCAPGSVDAFLLERYQAFTFRGGRGTRFRVAHAPWQAQRADWVRFDLGFLAAVYPWLSAANFHSAHLCGHMPHVAMGLPHRVPLPVRGGARVPTLLPIPALTRRPAV